MRITAFILAILVLILSCLPCSDIAAMPVMQSSSQNETTKSPVQHQDEHGDIDLCSPFCHCACCAGFSIIPSPSAIPVRMEATELVSYSLHLPAEAVEISLPVWQPPQLV